MARDLIQRLRDHAWSLARSSGQSASVSADVVVEYGPENSAVRSEVTYSGAMVIAGVKRFVTGSDTPRDVVAAMLVLNDVESLRSQARYFGYGLVRLPDADDREAGQ